MIKANKIDMEFLRNEAKKFSLPDPETQKRFDQLVDAVEICAVIRECICFLNVLRKYLNIF